MDYKIIDINVSLDIKTTGGSSNPDTILSTMTFTDDKSHTDKYYLVVSASLEYAGRMGQVVVMTSEVMTATYGSDGYLESVTKPQIPTKENILNTVNAKAQDWVNDFNYQSLLRSYTESIRETIDLYNFELEDSVYTKPFDVDGPYDELLGLTTEIGGNTDRTVK